MRLWKMNGAGNAFAILDGRVERFRPDAGQIRDLSERFQADQVMVLEAHPSADAFLRIWNADGSEVAACGNGTRAAAHLLLEQSGKTEVRIQTETDLLTGLRAGRNLVRVDMGRPRTGWEDIPLSEKMDVRGIDVRIGPIDRPYLARPAVVSMGNPHTVFFVENIDDYDIPAIGPLVEWHPAFPEGTNVGFAQILDEQTIRLRVWERGAGLTKACGTGACAALVCAARAGKTGRSARLILDGGELTIHWDDVTDHVFMTGPVELEQTLDIEVQSEDC